MQVPDAVPSLARFCRSRNTDRRCARPLGHPGLHRHGALLWNDASADPPRCAGSEEHAAPAPPLPDGFPHGRALCERCLRFIGLDGEGRLVEHDTTDAAETDADGARAREWFNTHGW